MSAGSTESPDGRPPETAPQSGPWAMPRGVVVLLGAGAQS